MAGQCARCHYGGSEGAVKNAAALVALLLLAACGKQGALEPRAGRPAPVRSETQTRAATPQEAVANGADLLVIGRAVTKAADPQAAAAAVAAAAGA